MPARGGLRFGRDPLARKALVPLGSRYLGRAPCICLQAGLAQTLVPVPRLTDPALGRLLRAFHAAGKTTALVCHGPIALLSALDHPQDWKQLVWAMDFPANFFACCLRVLIVWFPPQLNTILTT